MALLVAFPLPRHLIERVGEGWWKPPHGVYNGAFRLVEFSASSLSVERNPDYFGAFHGNLDRIEWKYFKLGDPEMLHQFLENEIDLCAFVAANEFTAPIPKNLLYISTGDLLEPSFKI